MMDKNIRGMNPPIVCLKGHLLKHWETITVESLEFVVAQFSWYSWEAPPHEFTSSTKTNLERVIFVTETENLPIHEITYQRISQKPTIHEKWLPRI